MNFSTLSDILVMVKRNLLRYKRLPQLVVFSLIQPVMFVLWFAYVFGGAIHTDSGTYINYLLPGILVQTVLFGAMQTGVGLADDLSKGMIDRFRSLPMARSAVLAGRTITETIRNLFVVALMSTVGFMIGFRFQGGFGHFVLALLMTVLFGFAFASSIFVPIESMKSGIKLFAEHNPVSYTVNVVRALSLGTPVGDDLWYALAWIGGIMIVFIPLAVNLYRKRT